MRNTTGSLEIDWLHLWSLSQDNVLLFNHALCHCALQGFDCHQQLHQCLIVHAKLIGRLCFSVEILILFTVECPSDDMGSLLDVALFLFWRRCVLTLQTSFCGSEVLVFTHWHQRGLVIVQLHKPSKNTRYLPARHLPTLLSLKVFELRFEDEFDVKKAWRNALPMGPQGYAFVLIHRKYLPRSLDFPNPVKSFCGGSHFWRVFSSPLPSWWSTKEISWIYTICACGSEGCPFSTDSKLKAIYCSHSWPGSLSVCSGTGTAECVMAINACKGEQPYTVPSMQSEDYMTLKVTRSLSITYYMTSCLVIGRIRKLAWSLNLVWSLKDRVFEK